MKRYLKKDLVSWVDREIECVVGDRGLDWDYITFSAEDVIEYAKSTGKELKPDFIEDVVINWYG